MNKSEEYLKISEEIVNGVGGMDGIKALHTVQQDLELS